MSTAEAKTENQPEATSAPETATEAAPEAPTPSEAPQPQGDVRKCDITAVGTFDKGVADLAVEEDCEVELARTQLLILVKDGIRYTFTRTNIKPLK